MRLTYYLLRSVTFISSTVFLTETVYRQWFTHTLHFFRHNRDSKVFLMLITLGAAACLVFLLVWVLLTEILEIEPLDQNSRRQLMNACSIGYLISIGVGIVVYLQEPTGIAYLWRNNALIVVLYCMASLSQLGYDLCKIMQSSETATSTTEQAEEEVAV